ncbi:MAG: hypothetical protein ACTHU0_36645, partial [Kofleriaceae bacterium]
PAIANTLATAEAEQGDVTAAKRHEWGALERAARKPGPSDWYVVGRIAEQLGLLEDARAAYQKVAPEPEELAAITAHQFAQRRLRQLGKR